MEGSFSARASTRGRNGIKKIFAQGEDDPQRHGIEIPGARHTFARSARPPGACNRRRRRAIAHQIEQLSEESLSARMTLRRLLTDRVKFLELIENQHRSEKAVTLRPKFPRRMVKELPKRFAQSRRRKGDAFRTRGFHDRPFDLRGQRRSLFIVMKSDPDRQVVPLTQAWKKSRGQQRTLPYPRNAVKNGYSVVFDQSEQFDNFVFAPKEHVPLVFRIRPQPDVGGGSHVGDD